MSYIVLWRNKFANITKQIYLAILSMKILYIRYMSKWSRNGNYYIVVCSLTRGNWRWMNAMHWLNWIDIFKGYWPVKISSLVPIACTINCTLVCSYHYHDRNPFCFGFALSFIINQIEIDATIFPDVLSSAHYYDIIMHEFSPNLLCAEYLKIIQLIFKIFLK